MKELSLNILDISQNSIKAEATVIYITIVENDETLTVTVEDDGYGMSREMLENVTNPFCTSRTTRKVGLGIPFLKEAAEQTGGEFSITSKSREEFPDSHGTVTKASFFKKHLDYTPLGDIVSTVSILIQGAGEVETVFSHKIGDAEVNLDTRELRAVLGADVSLAEPEVMDWICSYLREQYNNIKNESEENK